jgi:hypothetical protein
MKQLETRLEELEARRAAGGLTPANMSDFELITYLTNGKSATISDAELALIIAGATVENQGSHGDQAG